jgi:hypothetical protein
VPADRSGEGSLIDLISCNNAFPFLRKPACQQLLHIATRLSAPIQMISFMFHAKSSFYAILVDSWTKPEKAAKLYFGGTPWLALQGFEEPFPAVPVRRNATGM